MWYYYLIAIVIACGVGVGAGIGFEKLGQALYYRRNSGVQEKNPIKVEYDCLPADYDNEEVEAIFLGDSITDGYRIGDFFLGKRYLNRGIGGDTTTGVLNRLDKNVIRFKPKKLIMMIGTNDLAYNTEPTEIVANIAKIVAQIKKSLPKTEVYVQTVYPIDERLCKSNRTSAKINLVNDGIRKLEGITVVEMDAVLADNNGKLRRAYTGDGLHLLTEGYIEVTKVLKEKCNL